jgi:hypothetical protein
MKKRLQKKWGKRKPRILVNDKRYFKPDNMSPGTIVAYAVYIPGERERVTAC